VADIDALPPALPSEKVAVHKIAHDPADGGEEASTMVSVKLAVVVPCPPFSTTLALSRESAAHVMDTGVPPVIVAVNDPVTLLVLELLP
jgi:hypothetical protein